MLGQRGQGRVDSTQVGGWYRQNDSSLGQNWKGWQNIDHSVSYPLSIRLGAPYGPSGTRIILLPSGCGRSDG